MHQEKRLRTILIVEDEVIIARDIQEKLRDLDYLVPAVARSGEDALTLIDEVKPDLILMDILLEGNINGIEVAELIKEQYDIPLIFLTSLGNKDILIKAKNTDPYGYLLKPFQDQELFAAIETAFNRYTIEKELEESRNYFSTTLSCIGDAVITTDNSGLITFLNAIAEELTGWSCGEAAGKSIETVFRIINENTRAQAPNPVYQVLEKGMITGFANHTILVSRDGREIPIDDSGSPIKSRDGKITGVVLVFRDVTVQRKYMKETEHLKKMYGDILNYIIDGIWASDKEDVIYYVNTSMTRIAGIQASDLVGKHVLKDFSNATIGYFVSYYENVKKTMLPYNYKKIPVLTPGNRQTLQSGWLIPMSFDGDYDGMICTINKVT